MKRIHLVHGSRSTHFLISSIDIFGKEIITFRQAHAAVIKKKN